MSNERTLIGSTVEDLVLEISFWLVFYPYTLVRLILAPKRTMAVYMVNVRQSRDPTPIVRAPVFLLITVAFGILLDGFIGQEEQRHFIKLAQLMNVPAGLVPLVDGSVFYIALAIANAVLIEMATPDGVSRESFRPALLGNMLIVTPLLIADMAITMIVSWLPQDADLSQPDQLRQALLGIVLLALAFGVTLFYYLRTQAIQYRLLHAGGRWASVMMPLAALVVCAVLLSLLPELLTK